MQRIKIGDKVRLISGDEKGKEGIVLKVLPSQGRAIVEGLNVVTCHKKPNNNAVTTKEREGGLIKKPAPIFLSKLALVVPKSTTGISKIKYTLDKNKNKVRIAKKTNTEIVSNTGKAGK